MRKKHTVILQWTVPDRLFPVVVTLHLTTREYNKLMKGKTNERQI